MERERQTGLGGRVICGSPALLSALLAACTNTPGAPEPLQLPLPDPLPEPIDAQSAGLRVSLAVFETILPGSYRPETVLFVRLEESEEMPDPSREPVLIPSSFAHGDYAYLLNARPGRYVAVAALRARDTGPTRVPLDELSYIQLDDGRFDEVVYFSRPLVAASLTTVEPASFAFMGSLTAEQAFFFGGLDEFRSHFRHTLEKQGVAPMDEDLNFRVELRSADKQAAAPFYDATRRLLQGTAWEAAIERSLARAENVEASAAGEPHER